MASIPLLRLSPPLHKTLTPKSRLHSNLTPPSLHPVRSTVQISRSVPPRTLTVSASYNSTPVPDRLISAAAYFFPFFNGLQYGRFLFSQYPKIFAPILQPLLPLLSFYRSIPFASFITFMLLYSGVVRNPSFSKYVRFNAMQAVVLDVLLAVPMILQQIVAPHPRGVGLQVMTIGHNFIFVFIAVCFGYSLVSSVLGRTPYLPLVADAAGRQM